MEADSSESRVMQCTISAADRSLFECYLVGVRSIMQGSLKDSTEVVY